MVITQYTGQLKCRSRVMERARPTEGESRLPKNPQRPPVHFWNGPEYWAAHANSFALRVRNLIPNGENLPIKMYHHRGWVAFSWYPGHLLAGSVLDPGLWTSFVSYLISFPLLLPSFILLFLFLLEDSGKTYTNCHAECVINKNLWGFFGPFWFLPFLFICEHLWRN